MSLTHNAVISTTCLLLVNAFWVGSLATSLDISASPSTTVEIGDNITITSVIKNSLLESWRAHIFIINNGLNELSCFTVPYPSGSTCRAVLGFCPGYSFDCDFNRFNLHFTNVHTNISGYTVKSLLTFNVGNPIFSSTILLQIDVPLRNVNLIPNGTVTIKMQESQVFRCSAISLPKPSLRWTIGSSTPTTLEPPLQSDTGDYRTSEVIYAAQKTDNKKSLVCTANNGGFDVTATALLDIQYTPTVIISPEISPYHVLENYTNLRLVCIGIDSNPVPTVYRWYKDNILKYSDAICLIKIVNRSDAGNYTCDAINIVGASDRSNVVTLYVLYGVYLYPISKQRPIEGKQFSVSCNGESNPMLDDNDVTWTKQGNTTFIQRQRQLLIPNINRKDSGVYICNVIKTLKPSNSPAVNVTGTTSVEIDVLYVPNVVIDPAISDYNVLENYTNIRLVCNGSDSNPAPDLYKWYKDNTFKSSELVFLIPTTNKADAGNYTCDATNIVGTSDRSDMVTLNVLYGIRMETIAAQKPVDGMSFSVSCDGQSNPPLLDTDVKWTKQGNITFKQSGRQLFIRNVNKEDRGVYICNVTKTLTPTYGPAINVTGTTFVKTDVLYRPIVTILPSYNPYTIIENTINVQLTCTVTDSNPPASSYLWYKDDSVLSSTATYTMLNIKKSDAGNYSCIASNNIGSSDVSSETEIIILYIPAITETDSNQTVIENATVVVTCKVESKPLPNVTWMFENTILDTDETFNLSNKLHLTYVISTLTIRRIKCLSMGTYRCIANNMLGKTNRSMHVFVECSPRVHCLECLPPVIPIKEAELLNITVPIIAFPKPTILWKFLENGISINASGEIFSYDNMNKHSTTFFKRTLTSADYGSYCLYVYNGVGNMTDCLYSVEVISVRKPTRPYNVHVVCKSTTASLFWQSPYNGGTEQYFKVQLWMFEESTRTLLLQNISDPGFNFDLEFTVSDLSFQTSYWFIIFAINAIGNSSSKIVNCTTDGRLENTNSHIGIGLFAAGISALILTVIIVAVLISVHCLHKTRKKSKRSRNYVDLETIATNSNDAYSSLSDIAFGYNKESDSHFENIAHTYEEFNITSHNHIEHSCRDEKLKGKKKKNVVYANMDV